MAELIMVLVPIWWLVVAVAAVLLFLLPFFVFRIRNELIALNRTHGRVLALLESVIPESKKPQVATKTCATCRTVNTAAATRCSHCGDKFAAGSVPGAQRSIITKENGVPVKICVKCDHRNEPLAAKCRSCGAEI